MLTSNCMRACLTTMRCSHCHIHSTWGRTVLAPSTQARLPAVAATGFGGSGAQKRYRSSSAAVDPSINQAIEGAKALGSHKNSHLQWRQAFTLARAAPQVSPVGSNALPANICMIGAGNMGGAMVKGWIASGSISPERTAACTRSEDRAQEWKDAGLAEVFGDASDNRQAQNIARFADIIFLGVKPQFLSPVLKALAPHITARHTVVSIAAGWTIPQLEAALPEGSAVIRIMPNTPILIGQGASAYVMGTHASDEDRQAVHRLLQDTGIAIEVPESAIDAVVGVAGSAPAYMFQVLEAMADGGVRAGLPRHQALQLAAQTMKGAACMVLEGGDDSKPNTVSSLGHPGVLKDQVTSPGGATIAALAEMERRGVRSAFIEAVSAAVEKSAAMAALGADPKK